MSFKNVLSEDNKYLFRKYLKDLYSAVNICRFEISVLLLQWIFEYFCSYWFIDTDEDVNITAVKKRMPKEYIAIHGMLSIVYNLRNCATHTPYVIEQLFEKYRLSLIDMNTYENIKMFCSVFEEDASKFESMYKEIMKYFGCVKEKKEESQWTLPKIED